MRKPNILISYLFGFATALAMFGGYFGLSFLPASTFKGIILLLWIVLSAGFFLGQTFHVIRLLLKFEKEAE